MRIPDPRSLVLPQLRKNDRSLSQMGIAQLQSLASTLEAGLASLEQMRDELDNDGFKWLINSFLPTERRRIADARSSVALDANYRDRQLIVDGQIAEIDEIIEKVSDVEKSIIMMRGRLEQVKRATNAWAKRKKDTRLSA